MVSLRSGRILRRLLLAGLLACMGMAARAQTTPAILLSDLHLDPFHDPAKAQRLFVAPAEAWPAILAEPDSAGRDTAFAALQKHCNGSSGADTSYPLLTSALQAAHAQSPEARFVTVSGDLIGHNFDCRFLTLLPGHSRDDYRGFVEKTEHVVAAELRRAFPALPIYVTLGNNDSDCGDYRLTPGSAFLADLAPLFIDDLARATGRDRTSALASFRRRGDYNLPLPLHHARIVAISNIYLAANYRPCPSKPTTRPFSANGQEQITWLRGQLAQARRLHQQLWVMGHLPPGIDLYATVTNARDVCAGQPPLTFLRDDSMTQALLSGTGIIRLALFAHTHMDEMRLLQPPGGSGNGDIPVKLVSSVSPINGNEPSFTIAQVQPATATMTDYAVYSASNHTGVDTLWRKEYDYGAMYHEPAFDGPSLDQLTAKFLADRKGSSHESQVYIHAFYAGLGSTLTPLWPAYVCVITHTTPESYTDCACQGQKK